VAGQGGSEFGLAVGIKKRFNPSMVEEKEIDRGWIMNKKTEKKFKFGQEEK